MILCRPILLALIAVVFVSTSARATMTEAEVALGAHDYVAARALLMDEADHGDADAQFRLGVLFDRGRGGMASPKAASVWFSRAAAQGHVAAMHAIGTYYEIGKGVTQDHVLAARWYGAAADVGDAKAQRNLANLYLNGLGVERDYDRAAELSLRPLRAATPRRQKTSDTCTILAWVCARTCARQRLFLSWGPQPITPLQALPLGCCTMRAVACHRALTWRNGCSDVPLMPATLMPSSWLRECWPLVRALRPISTRHGFWLLLAEAQKPAAARYYLAKLAAEVPDEVRDRAASRARNWQPRD